MSTTNIADADLPQVIPPSNHDESSLKKQKQNLRKQVRTNIKLLPQEDIATQSAEVWRKLFSLEAYKQAKSVGLFLSMPKGEILTEEPCRRVLMDGKTLYVPRVGLDFEKCDMELTRVSEVESTSVRDKNKGRGIVNGDNYDTSGSDLDVPVFYAAWPRNKWGIPEAPLDEDHPVAQVGDIDLLVVPGLAFDKYGGRLGQGKGYYDRFITKMKGSSSKEKDEQTIFMGYKKPLLVAVGLEPSFVEPNDLGENETSEKCQNIIPMTVHDHPMDMVIVPHLEILKVSTDK